MPATMMDTALPLRQALVEQTILGIASFGLEDITLRTIAAAAGCSTAGVFQHFAGKSEMVETALERALILDTQFHEDFSLSVAGLTFGLDRLAVLLSAYIEMRATSPIAAFWSEIIFKSRQLDAGLAILRQWVAMREKFWAERLAEAGLDNSLGSIVQTYLLMEEVYSYALRDRVEYILMLRETTKAFVERYFMALDSECDSVVSKWASGEETPFKIDPVTTDMNSLKERLISYAIPEIIAHGIPALNLRKIAKQAKASPSMIAYHFGDTESFINEAVWRALIQDIPHEIDPNRMEGTPVGTINDWTSMLANLIRPHQGDVRPGFYVGVARLIGQAALFARRHKDLLPVILHLRKIEGAGTYRASQTIWPSGFAIDRASATVFGIWVKGQAVMNETVSRSNPAQGEDILSVASYLFRRKN
jgi:AcrR family transcriptional regulator